MSDDPSDWDIGYCWKCDAAPCLCETGPTQDWRQGYSAAFGYPPPEGVGWTREHQLGWQKGKEDKRLRRREEREVDVQRRQDEIRQAMEQDGG